jgi:hypothetical protein
MSAFPPHSDISDLGPPSTQCEHYGLVIVSTAITRPRRSNLTMM